MSEENKHMSYSLADIERYLNGSMDAKEMHEIEKASLQDVFLADAIEGYREASLHTSHKHLNEINAALYGKQNELNVVAIKPATKNNWFKIAAAFLIVAGVATLSWYLLNKNNTYQALAFNKDSLTAIPGANIAANDSTKNATAFADTLQSKKEKKTSNSAIVSQDVAANESHLSNGDKLSSYKKNDLQSAGLSEKQNGFFSSSTPAVKMNKVTSDSLTFNFDAAANAANILSGKIMNSKNLPIAGATVVVKGTRDSVRTDSAGNFTLLTNTDNANIIIRAHGYKTTDTLMNYNKNLFVIADSPSWLSQIPVTDFSTKRNANSFVMETNGGNAIPRGGWVSFQDYVNKRLHGQTDSLTSDDYASGNVEVEFSINSDGVPYDFVILKSLDEQRDAKAINILREGPRWIVAGKNKKGKVSIQF